jgi:hypothetical protein
MKDIVGVRIVSSEQKVIDLATIADTANNMHVTLDNIEYHYMNL